MEEAERNLRLVIVCLIPNTLAVTTSHVRKITDEVLHEMRCLDAAPELECSDTLATAANIVFSARLTVLANARGMVWKCMITNRTGGKLRWWHVSSSLLQDSYAGINVSGLLRTCCSNDSCKRTTLVDFDERMVHQM